MLFKADRRLQAVDASSRIVAQFPISLGGPHDPIPVGKLKIAKEVRDPVFNYDPVLIRTAKPSYVKTDIAADPNNPVGVVWMGLTKPHYGTHGTPEPSQVGKSETQGCVHLTNWDALKLSAIASPGVVVDVRAWEDGSWPCAGRDDHRPRSGGGHLLADDGISRRHAKVERRDGALLLSDLGSANGTYLNDQRVTGIGLRLAKEDMLRIGTSILKFLPAGELEIIFYGNLGAAAHTDPLTRIYNKGYLLEALGAEWKRARALRIELSLVFFDLDHFKKVNDTFGHDAGDYVLQELAWHVGNELLAPRDIFARYGGEEFAVLLPNTSGSRALELAERIRAAVEAHAFVYEGRRLPVTCSMGVATLHLGIDSAAALLKAGDMAGYASKRRGRNRVTMADPLAGEPASG